jgi:predicted PurR-regulated permease PerM
MGISRYVSSNATGPHLTGGELPPSAIEIAIVGFIVVVALYFGQVVLVPLALAVILSFILAPPVRLLRRLGLSNAPAVFLVVAFAFAIIFGVGALITQQVGSLASELPRYQLTLKDKVKALKDAAAGSGGAIERASSTLKDLQEELEKSANGPAQAAAAAPAPAGSSESASGPARPIPVEVHQPKPTPLDQLLGIIGVIVSPLATAGLVLLFVVFLLLQREDVRDRAIRLLGAHDLEKTTVAMDDAGQRLSQYFLTFTAINAVYGVIIGSALWALGMPSPVLWGALAMLMRFVPFIGAFIAAAFPVLLAAAVDSGWSLFLATLALYVVGEIIMGNFIEPVVQGQRTGLSPLAIVLSTAFWTLLWGPIGLLLAIPLTVVLVVLGRHVDRLEFLHVLLGDTPPLSPAERFYQRMLAGDPAEAVEQAEKIIKESSLLAYYDDVAIEALRLAQTDADRGTLDASRLPDILDTAGVVIDTLSDHDLVPKKRTEAKPNGEEAPEREGTAEVTAEDEPDTSRAIALVDPESLAPDWRRPGAVLCVASRTALDQAAALMLAQLLEKCGIGAKAIGPSEVRHGALSEEREGARLICISALDVRERSAHARFLVRRLKRFAPDALLLGGFWKLDPDAERDRTIADSVAVDARVFSLREALDFCLRAAVADNLDEESQAPELTAVAAS